MILKSNTKYFFAIVGLISSIILSGCSTADLKNVVSDGNALSTTDTKYAATNPKKVKLYYSSADAPKHYKIIGRVSANNQNLVAIDKSLESITEELKKQAASLGANAVINIRSDITKTSGDAVIVK